MTPSANPKPYRSFQGLPIAFSPCPNDAFLFHAWVHRFVCPELPVTPLLADVQHLNQWATQGRYPVTKLSFACLGSVLDNYVLLRTGAALGRGCGPKLIARESFSLNELPCKRVAIPGRDTTAHLLLQLLAPEPKLKRFCLYNEIEELLDRGNADCGLIIHETRFTFAQAGFVEIADLGALWEQRYGVPIPLGGIAAHRRLGSDKLLQIQEALRQSLQFAWDNPEASQEYILRHSQERDPAVVQRHVDLYVNEETLELSEEGQRSVELLFELGREKGVLPATEREWLLEGLKVG